MCHGHNAENIHIKDLDKFFQRSKFQRSDIADARIIDDSKKAAAIQSFLDLSPGRGNRVSLGNIKNDFIKRGALFEVRAIGKLSPSGEDLYPGSTE